MTVALVVVDHRTAERTTRLAHAVAAVVDRIVVVANPADDGTPGPAAADLPPGTTLVEPSRNVGFGAGANLGAAEAPEADVLVVANPDVEVDPPVLQQLVAAAAGGGVAAVAPRIVDAGGALVRATHDRVPGLVATLVELSPAAGWLLARTRPGWHPTLVPAADEDDDLDCAHVLGAIVAFAGPAFRAAGGFDERFFLYREETDLCLRLRAAGGRVRHLGTVTATHEGDASSADHRPLFSRATMLESHYAFIALHRGRATAVLARALGLLASASWAITGPDRAAGRAALRWHATGGRGRRS